MYQIILSWFYDLLTGTGEVMHWLSRPIAFGDVEFYPLAFLTFGGLSAYLIFAIAKWVIS